MERLLILALVGLLGAGCRSTRPPEAPAGPHLRLLSYNVNWGAPHPELAVEIIRRSGADIVCLQETTPDWEEILRRDLGKEYPLARFRSPQDRLAGGLAFLSKVPGREVAYIPSETGWFDGWILAFESPAGSLQVLNVHLQPPISDRGSWVSGYLFTGDDRVREMERFHAGLEPGLPAVVAGDFNDGEESPVVHWLEERGFRNALPEFDRYTPTWEWHTSSSLVTLRRRMDHVLYSPELDCLCARVLRAGASDHFPVEAVFRENQGRRKT